MAPPPRRRSSHRRLPLACAATAAALLAVPAFVGRPSRLQAATHAPSPRGGGAGCRSAASARAAAGDDGKQGSYEALANVPLERAADGTAVALPTLWGPEETVAVVFARHFG